ncbi:MAG: DsbC family protein [Gammaproteobacteria bacterium]|nr:DsbC family protein [Gammaproteobacteria bacterium]
MKKLSAAFIVIIGLAFGPGLSVAMDDESLATVRKNLETHLPGIPVTSLQPGPIEGLYELITEGQIYYLDATATHLIDGMIIDLATRANLTENRLGGLHFGLLEEIGEDQMIVYPAKEDTGRSITVFTDITCGYCRRLHQDLDTLLEAGVSVRYLLFPRAGLNSDAAANLESVWCSDDPLQAMTDAKAGKSIKSLTCENPIESHVALAEKVGLRGTPLIYLDNGERVPGYRDPKVLAESINNSEPLTN